MINNLFNPSSVAIIGASEKEDKWGFQILSNLISNGFEGDIYPINPKSDYILGEKVYKSINDIKDNVDLVVIVIPAQFVADVLRDCGYNGIKAAIVISAGFSELGKHELEEELVKVANMYDISLIGPNTFGTICKSSKLNVSLIGEL